MGIINTDEASTWISARDGDSESFASIFDTHHDRVFYHALRFVRSPHDAEDITAMVFLEAWRLKGRVRLVEGSVIAWLLVTTNNVARNFTRASRRYEHFLRQLPLGEGGDDPFEDVDDEIDSDSRGNQVRRILGQMPQKSQDVVTLCILQECTLVEAAGILGVPVGTVKSRLSRAKTHLAALTSANTDDFISALGGAR